jgi:hypothetical protein
MSRPAQTSSHLCSISRISHETHETHENVLGFVFFVFFVAVRIPVLNQR